MCKFMQHKLIAKRALKDCEGSALKYYGRNIHWTAATSRPNTQIKMMHPPRQKA
jgi:hypothetical protein